MAIVYLYTVDVLTSRKCYCSHSVRAVVLHRWVVMVSVMTILIEIVLSSEIHVR